MKKGMNRLLEFLEKLIDFGSDVGIDLGTATVLVYVKDKGIVIREPSVVSLDVTTGKVLKVGVEAQEMIGRTPENVIAVRPLKDGVIADYDTAEKMIKYFLSKVSTSKIIKPRVVVCVPSGVTDVEQRAVIEATMHAGARNVYILEEPIAAAIGAGIDISKPYGSMIVDIGGGTTDVAVISMGGIVCSESIRIAGDAFDEAIMKYLKRKYNLHIGARTAEEVKREIGSAYLRDETIFCSVKGNSLGSNMPQAVNLSSDETLQALEEPLMKICETVNNVLENTPPELMGDITARGITMTGGGSLIFGLDKLIQRETGIKTHVAPDAVSCVAIGTGTALEHLEDSAIPFRNKMKRYDNKITNY
jgi:rod shape-determining protein MreB